MKVKLHKKRPKSGNFIELRYYGGVPYATPCRWVDTGVLQEKKSGIWIDYCELAESCKKIRYIKGW